MCTVGIPMSHLWNARQESHALHENVGRCAMWKGYELEAASHESIQQDGERFSRTLGIQQLSRRSRRYKCVTYHVEWNSIESVYIYACVETNRFLVVAYTCSLFLFLDLFYIVYSIVNEEPNAEECKSKIKAYEEANRAQIVIRQSQRADEERSIQDRIASEQREAERNKRGKSTTCSCTLYSLFQHCIALYLTLLPLELQEEEKAIALTKRKLKQESTQVALGVSPLTFLVHHIVCSSIVSHCI